MTMEQSDPDRTPHEVCRDALAAARAVIDDSEHDLGAAVVVTLPPQYREVRYVSNLQESGAASLLRATADQIEQQTNGGPPDGPTRGNIETP